MSSQSWKITSRGKAEAIPPAIQERDTSKPGERRKGVKGTAGIRRGGGIAVVMGTNITSNIVQDMEHYGSPVQYTSSSKSTTTIVRV